MEEADATDGVVLTAMNWKKDVQVGNRGNHQSKNCAKHTAPYPSRAHLYLYQTSQSPSQCNRGPTAGHLQRPTTTEQYSISDLAAMMTTNSHACTQSDLDCQAIERPRTQFPLVEQLQTTGFAAPSDPGDPHSLLA
jgi:hypothetical protein